MKNYALPVTGYRAQCPRVDAADQLTLLVEWRDGLYERLDVRLRGVEIADLERSKCPVQPCTCGYDIETQQAQAAKEWVEIRLIRDEFAYCFVTMQEWGLRVELTREGGEWLVDVWYLQTVTDAEYAKMQAVSLSPSTLTTQEKTAREVHLNTQLISEGHAGAMEGEK